MRIACASDFPQYGNGPGAMEWTRENAPVPAPTVSVGLLGPPRTGRFPRPQPSGSLASRGVASRMGMPQSSIRSPDNR
jgi:hypothetical protein